MRSRWFLSVLVCCAAQMGFSQVEVSPRACVQGVLSAANSEISGALEASAAQPLPEVIIIPVVVHVVYNTSAQNISDAQIASQIETLNKDFRKKNADAVQVPAAFRDIAADARIEFRLATKDAAGLNFNGIVRKNTSVTAFGINDDIKFSGLGGDDAWDRNRYLNIWVGNLSGGIMGYASVPGCVPEKDGVVISYRVFGTTANVQSPYHKGRTAVHEVGHWLSLRHIWGDTDCGDDQIEDTPPQEGPTRGCPRGVVATCSSGSAGNMYMNFMDFTNDECLNMFTAGQATRMRSLFLPGEARHALLSSDAAQGAEVTAGENIVAMKTSVYPNPASAFLEFRLEDGAGGGGPITVYNQMGQVVLQIVAKGTLNRIDIGSLKNGMYFIRSGSGQAVRFIKGR